MLRGRLFAHVLMILLKNYLVVEDFFRRHIEENDLFADQLQDQRRELTTEYEAITLLYRTNSKIDPISYHMERWTIEAVKDFNAKAHEFIRKILEYAELQNELLHKQVLDLHRQIDEGV